MNNVEFAELIKRENTARSFGFTSNHYVCTECLRDGKSEAGSTYLDWPTHEIDGRTVCEKHATRGRK